MKNTIKQKLKKNKLIFTIWLKWSDVRTIINNIKNRVNSKISAKKKDRKAVKNFKTERKLQHALVDGKVNVGFVFTQGEYDWGKTEPILLALENDGRFNITVICFPPWIGEKRLIIKDKTKNTNYDFIKSRLKNKSVNILDGWFSDDEVVDLKTFDFSYVFFTSPYPEFSPESYHPSIVSKYTKICYTHYGFTLSKIFYPISSSWNFFRWLYCCYCVSSSEKEFFDERLRKNKTLNLQRNVFCGFPRIYQFAEQKKCESFIWTFSKNSFRVIWTPRWSTDDSIGGSNFFKYKDFMLNLIKDNSDIDFLFRPHPLTFGNFIKTGQMTRVEIDDYKKAWKNDNSCLDETVEYAPTFWHSNILITDFSSIIIEYFITENPIIFCTTKTSMDTPTEEFEKILSCCYIANNEDDIKIYLNQIHNGYDPFKEKRLIVIEEIFGYNFEHIPKCIAEDLWQDYWKNK